MSPAEDVDKHSHLLCDAAIAKKQLSKFVYAVAIPQKNRSTATV